MYQWYSKCLRYNKNATIRTKVWAAEAKSSSTYKGFCSEPIAENVSKYNKELAGESASPPSGLWKSNRSYVLLDQSHHIKSKTLGDNATMADNLENEYGTVIRVGDYTQAPATHEILPASSPAHMVQFCRTMTLAQGRVLYEVWDRNHTQGYQWLTPHVQAYLVPAHIAAEAREISCRDHREDWKTLPPVMRGRYEAAWEVVVREWPGMPIFAARKAVEESMRMGLGWGKEGIEEAVVGYGLRNWTSYWVRLGGRRGFGAEEEVKKVVKARLREVLRSWMRADAEEREVFGRHGLLEDVVKERVASTVRFT